MSLSIPSKDQSAGQISAVLKRATVVAVVGASLDSWRPSFGVGRYLQRQGFRVIPVNPRYVGEKLGGESFVGSLRNAPVAVDIADVFRRSDVIDEVVDDVIASRIPTLWLQLGISHEPACARAESCGITVVRNRCISVEHARLLRC